MGERGIRGAGGRNKLRERLELVSETQLRGDDAVTAEEKPSDEV